VPNAFSYEAGRQPNPRSPFGKYKRVILMSPPRRGYHTSTSHRVTVGSASAAEILKAIVIMMTTVGVLAATVCAGTVKSSIELAGTYAVRGSGINGFGPVFSMSNAVIAGLAEKYVGDDAVLGSTPQPIIAVQYPASLLPFPLSELLPNNPVWDESVALGVAALQGELANNAEDSAPVIFGYSQGAHVASEYKKIFNSDSANQDPATARQPTWVLIGNPARPNGGFFQRFEGIHVPFFEATFKGSTPTTTAGSVRPVTTYDISAQYDMTSDFPMYPVNVLADVNAVLGFFLVHTNFGDIGPIGLPGYVANRGYLDMADAIAQDRYGDTQYYLIPAKRLPLLMPLALLGIPDPVLAVLDAPLRVLVETGYDRTVSPGEPTTARLVPAVDPVKLARNLLLAVPTGLDDGLQQVGLGRPFGTAAANAYGVGGPPVALQDNFSTLLSDTPSTQRSADNDAQEPSLDTDATPRSVSANATAERKSTAEASVPKQAAVPSDGTVEIGSSEPPNPIAQAAPVPTAGASSNLPSRSSGERVRRPSTADVRRNSLTDRVYTSAPIGGQSVEPKTEASDADDIASTRPQAPHGNQPSEKKASSVNSDTSNDTDTAAGEAA
jgi:PE-PPE domain